MIIPRLVSHDRPKLIGIYLGRDILIKASSSVVGMEWEHADAEPGSYEEEGSN